MRKSFLISLRWQRARSAMSSIGGLWRASAFLMTLAKVLITIRTGGPISLCLPHETTHRSRREDRKLISIGVTSPPKTKKIILKRPLKPSLRPRTEMTGAYLQISIFWRMQGEASDRASSASLEVGLSPSKKFAHSSVLEALFSKCDGKTCVVARKLMTTPIRTPIFY